VIEIKKVRKLGADLPWVQKLAAIADSEGGPSRISCSASARTRCRRSIG